MPALPPVATPLQVAECLFIGARTPSRWLDTAVHTSLLREVFEVARHGPTSMNCQPLRVIFLKGPAARARLAACVNPGNVSKVNTAPVLAVLGHDMAFPEQLGTLFAHKTDARSYYDGKPDVIASTALRNSSLQAAWLMMAARLMGLDCGPMSGFNHEAVDEAFWRGTQVKTNFLCALGYGDFSGLKSRHPRLAFDEVCQVVEDEAEL